MTEMMAFPSAVTCKNRISPRRVLSFLFIFGIVVILLDMFYLDNNVHTFLPSKMVIGKLMDSNQFLEKCPKVSPKLIGLAKVVKDEDRWMKLLIMKGLSYTVEMGGSYEPVECQPLYNVAIVVPFRDREAHLNAFLANLHPFLQRQQLAYTIFIVEQTNSSSFNRGILMNIGYVEALNQSSNPFDCFYFHDVDLVPEDDRHSYACPEPRKPRQMAVLMSKYKYKPLTNYVHFGGVTGMSTEDFRTINGFSNCYWGWGAEDDDLYQRVKSRHFTVTYHEPQSEARYTMLYHGPVEPNPMGSKFLDGASHRFNTDGLVNLQYRRLDLQLKPLYTHIIVDIQPN